MISSKQNFIESQTKLFGKLLLICDAAGTIIFSEGDRKVFGLSHSAMLHSDLYDIGFTMYSQLSIKNTLNSPEFQNKKVKSAILQIIKQDQINKKITAQTYGKGDRKNLIKKIYVQFQQIDVKFQKKYNNERVIPVQERCKSKTKQFQTEDTLIMLQVQELFDQQLQINTWFKDYQQTKRNYLQKAQRRRP